MPVQVQVVQSKPIAQSTEYLSLLKSRHSASINPQVEGYITKIFVKSGDRVDGGTPLLQIDPLKQEATLSSQEASRLAQEANLNLARINLDRAKKLWEAGVIAKSDLDNAQTNYETAVAQLKSLEQQVQQQRAAQGQAPIPQDALDQAVNRALDRHRGGHRHHHPVQPVPQLDAGSPAGVDQLP